MSRKIGLNNRSLSSGSIILKRRSKKLTAVPLRTAVSPLGAPHDIGTSGPSHSPLLPTADASTYSSKSFEWGPVSSMIVGPRDSSQGIPDPSRDVSNITRLDQIEPMLKSSFASLDCAGKILREQGLTLPQMSPIWEAIAEKSRDPAAARLNEVYKQGLISAESAYFLYAQSLSQGKDEKTFLQAQLKFLSTNSDLVEDQRPEAVSWASKISGLGDLISFVGLLGNGYRTSRQWSNFVPQWLHHPEEALALFEQRYRARLDEMHFTLRMPLEKIWSPRRVGQAISEQGFFQRIFSPSNQIPAQDLIHSWKAQPWLEPVRVFGKVSSSVLGMMGASWGILCSAAAGRVGLLGEGHGEKIFEWADKMSTRLFSKPLAVESNRAELSSGEENIKLVSHTFKKEREYSENGYLHLDKMVEIFPFEKN